MKLKHVMIKFATASPTAPHPNNKQQTTKWTLENCATQESADENVELFVTCSETPQHSHPFTPALLWQNPSDGSFTTTLVRTSGRQWKNLEPNGKPPEHHDSRRMLSSHCQSSSKELWASTKWLCPTLSKEMWRQANAFFVLKKLSSAVKNDEETPFGGILKGDNFAKAITACVSCYECTLSVVEQLCNDCNGCKLHELESCCKVMVFMLIGEKHCPHKMSALLTWWAWNCWFLC